MRWFRSRKTIARAAGTVSRASEGRFIVVMVANSQVRDRLPNAWTAKSLTFPQAPQIRVAMYCFLADVCIERRREQVVQ